MLCVFTNTYNVLKIHIAFVYIFLNVKYAWKRDHSRFLYILFYILCMSKAVRCFLHEGGRVLITQYTSLWPHIILVYGKHICEPSPRKLSSVFRPFTFISTFLYIFFFCLILLCCCIITLFILKSNLCKVVFNITCKYCTLNESFGN